MLAGGLAAAAGVISSPVIAADRPIAMRLADRPGDEISSLVFGSNEIGVMDGGPPSATS